MKIAVLLSGGVDSSLALTLLAEAGHELTAFYLKIWLEDEAAFLGACPWEEDLEYARTLCERLAVPLEVVPLQQAYHEKVVGFAVAELRAGRTPSPDIFCNSLVKFGIFLEKIDASFEAVASGHYARRVEENGRILLQLAPDPVKDQTYFLSRLSAAQLARARFPLGGLLKAEVRAMARARALPAMDRPDSQGICFLGKIKFRDFVKTYLGEDPGEIVDADTGKHLGGHRGLWFHTIGQRTGLGLSGGPWYVVAKDHAGKRLLVAHGERAPERSRTTFAVDTPHWINPTDPATIDRCKLRHGPQLLPCRFSAEQNGGRVTLAGEDRGIAPGQYAVFYDRDTCLGSAMIKE
jgi:tRNA-specific 2-thiouridylase